MAPDGKQRVAVIIPAYNEETRIGSVLRAVCQAKLADEVIVVSDGSVDHTVEICQKFPNVQVLELKSNVGKGGAMAAGVRWTKADVVAFVDADLKALKPDHVDQIIRPILSGACDMCIGVFRGGKFWSDTAQRITPYISGQRALKRSLFEGVPFIADLRMGVEVTLNSHARRSRARVLRVVLRGVSNSPKEQKMGIVKGLAARGQMYGEIMNAMVKVRKRRKPLSDKWRRP